MGELVPLGCMNPLSFLKLKQPRDHAVSSFLILICFQATPYDFLDQLTLRKYFYSFRDITIGGQCPCNGHASECPVDQATMVRG